MTGPIAELLAVAGPALGPRVTDADVPGEWGWGAARLLSGRNGFYAFESALHVFPLGAAVVGHELREWNAPDLWRHAYQDLDGALFFAEDVFGEQFCLIGTRVCRFTPETGEFEFVADGVEDWAGRVLADSRLVTGHPLGHEWQLAHGPLAPGTRLIPRLPFVLGGAYAVENLIAADSVHGMLARADIAHQIKDLPDGATITLRVID